MADDIPRSAELAKNIILGSPEMMTRLQTDPKSVLDEATELATANLPAPAYISDKQLYRLVVIVLGAVALVAIVGALVLSVQPSVGPDKIPDIMTALGAAAIGGMAGLLAPSPASK